MKNTISVSILLIFTTLAVACGETNPGPNFRDLTSQEQALVASSNQFGFDVFSKISQQYEDQDLFISPLSISLALGMTYNGARGSTEAGMRKTLGFGEMKTDDINQAYHGLMKYLVELDPKVRVEIANSIWYRKNLEILKTFIDINTLIFKAVIQSMDFSDEGSAESINKWVADNTHGKIESIVDPPIHPNTIMYLINAIYFNGTWTYQFDSADTEEAQFHLANDEKKSVKMMKSTISLPYFENETLQAVRIPYGHNLFNMTILLPKENQDIETLFTSLNNNEFNTLLGKMEKVQLSLGLPRFKLEYEKILNDVLIALGMSEAFSGQDADFSGIREAKDIYISRVKHKSFIEVDEKGTESAAVTSVEIRELSGPTEMLINRPFLFFIHDTNSKTLLFMGKITNPISQ